VRPLLKSQTSPSFFVCQLFFMLTLCFRAHIFSVFHVFFGRDESRPYGIQCTHLHNIQYPNFPVFNMIYSHSYYS
jgi:hypothetical protein